MKISEKDLLIVSCLRKDARMKLRDMSKATKIPVSTLFDKMMSYKNNGVIRKNTSLIRFERFGYNARALVVFSASKKDREKLLQTLNSNGNVNSLFKINNGWDFMAEVVFSDLKGVEDFLESIEEKIKVKKKRVFYVIDELKREEFFASPQKIKFLWRGTK